MVIVKQNPIGIDAVIHHLQKAVEKTSYGSLLDIYPRCYNTIRDNVETIEHYYSNGNYERVVFAEGNKCFFVQVGNDEREDNIHYSTQVDVYFTVDLNQLYPLITHRADNEARTEAINKLNKAVVYGSSSVSIDSVITGITNVYSRVQFRQNDDTQPYHCFKIRLNITYDPNKGIC